MNRDDENRRSEPLKPSRGEEALTNEERSLDIGESGQFAPGGYYNQQGVNEPRTSMDDEEIIPRARR